jgi:TPR repeat protein
MILISESRHHVVNVRLHLGNRGYNGDGVDQDYSEAARLFHEAIKQNQYGAPTDLGFMYLDGIGVSKDLVEAEKLFRQGLDQYETHGAGYDHRPAFGLATLFDVGGDDFARDPVVAAKWYEQAGTRGSTMAWIRLGMMYADGEGVPQDFFEAGKRFRWVVQNFGYVEAYGLSGDFFEKMGRYGWATKSAPHNTEEVIDQAIRWYQKAAAQGNAEGHFEAAKLYLENEDRVKAMQQFIWAAEKGSREALSYLPSEVEYLRRDAKNGDFSARRFLEENGQIIEKLLATGARN